MRKQLFLVIIFICNCNGAVAEDVRPLETAFGKCTYEGIEFNVGDSFPAIDGCNGCGCKKFFDGMVGVSCTERGCPPETIIHEYKLICSQQTDTGSAYYRKGVTELREIETENWKKPWAMAGQMLWVDSKGRTVSGPAFHRYMDDNGKVVDKVPALEQCDCLHTGKIECRRIWPKESKRAP